MEDVADNKVAHPPSRLPAARRTSRISRLLKLTLLLSAASAFSLLLPGPWSLLRDSTRSFETSSDAASQWKDDVWPLRPQTPWDISTDYPYPRLLEYDVTEGTWLRLDVHPRTGDIVFDILGDLYCLPGHAYSQDRLHAEEITAARPVLLGVPHDSDPHFSPEGDRLIFRSDAGLGVENIWIMRWKGCDEMNVRPENASQELQEALYSKEYEDNLLASGVTETPERKARRLLREGRLGARHVTNETYRWVSDARFHPSGSKVVATKWFTSARSLGAGEGYAYPVPALDSPKETLIPAGSGEQLVGRTLPLGWGVDSYGDQQIGPEQFIWRGNDSLIYAKNVADFNGQYTYSKDVHSGIYSIFATNLTTQRTTTLVDAYPGGASRPELSRDGRTLAFVRRVRDKEALVLKDLVTGTIRHIWHGLTYDLTTISAPMGTYPSFSFTPKDDAIIIWAAGQIYHVPLTTNGDGEKVSAGAPRAIRFTAHIEKRLAETVTSKTDLLSLETDATQRVYAFTDLRVNHNGSMATFQAAGATYYQNITQHGASSPQRVPALDPDAPYYAPHFVPGAASNLIVHARWSDTNFTTFELADLKKGVAYEIEELPLGRYYSPVLCETSGLERKIAFVKTGGDYITGNVVATAGAGLYIGDITLPSASSHLVKLAVRNLRFISSTVNSDDPSKTKIRFLEGHAKLLVQQSREAFLIDLKKGPNEFGEYDQKVVASGKMSSELVLAPSRHRPRGAPDVAFVDFFHVYFAPGVKPDEVVWSKPGNATKQLARLSLDGGHDIVWSGDGSKLFWFLGPFLHSIEVSKLDRCSSEVKKDHVKFGISCTKNLLEIKQLFIDFASDVHRQKTEATGHTDSGFDFFVITNATLLTMESGNLLDDVLHDAIVVSQGGKIRAIAGINDTVIPQGATVVNAQGGYVVPGYIDVHAHWNGFAEYYPARSWELETFLAYGITTLHNPSADNVRGFWERLRVERGQAVGPRIFQVGDVIYGAGEPGIHQDIADMDEAYSALVRIKAEGGPASFSYKNYNLPSRASRQRLLLAARNLSMLCVPEGGMNYDWDQTYIIDGMTTIEHPLPIPALYGDIITLFALSGTGSTPTHIVNYGGAFGEQYVWANEDIPNDSKLRRFTRHDILESLSESTARPKNSYALFNTSISTAKMVHKGLRAHIGAHGEPPLGLNYHAEMFFVREGGLSNYEVIRAATSDAAKTLGIYDSVGSITPGKLADLVIYPPGFDILEGDLRGTRDLKYVMRGGRVWDAETMMEVWPVKARKEQMPPINAE